jgi:hypothetical protein
MTVLHNRAGWFDDVHHVLFDYISSLRYGFLDAYRQDMEPSGRMFELSFRLLHLHLSLLLTGSNLPEQIFKLDWLRQASRYYG